ncbi:MAG: MerR family transcriptional regulator [Myxococcota bacterium]
MGREFTIDELAAETGVSSRTIRFYQSKKALPAPERRGRQAIYDDSHVERLRLIGRLQDQGLTIKAIRSLLSKADRGEMELSTWLGLNTELQVPWTDDDASASVSLDELVATMGTDREGMVAELVRAGVVKRTGSTFAVPSPALLAITLELSRAGVSPTISAEAAQMLRRHLSRAATEVSEHFLGRFGGSEAQAEQLTEMLDTLRPVTLEVVRLIFAQEMDAALQKAVASGTVRRRG